MPNPRTNRVRARAWSVVRALACAVALIAGIESARPAMAQVTKPAAPAPASGPAQAPATAPAPGWCEVLEAAPDPKVVTDPALREAITKTGLPWRVKDRASGIEMLLVPPGSFVMGKSPGDDWALETELPSHEVTLTKPFYLGRYEVTQQQYESVVGKNPSCFLTAVPSKSVDELMGEGYTKQEAEAIVAKIPLHADGPVEQVSWSDCSGFCQKAGLRLPTEAEWEYACRAGVRKPRYGYLDKITWFRGNSSGWTRTVGTKEANALGFHDMLGNVWEWVSDWYGPYGTSAETNPVGPDSGSYRVVRGGSWLDLFNYCRASYRSYYNPASNINLIGFRAARTP